MYHRIKNTVSIKTYLAPHIRNNKKIKMADATSAPSADEVPQVIAVSSDSAPTAENLSVITATSTNASANAATHRKRAKNIFLPLQKTNDRGKLLFLQNSNIKDLQLLRVLVIKLPWKAPYGQVTKAWEAVSDMCMEQRGVNDGAIFEEGSLNAKIIKDRFNNLYKWIRKETNASKKRTGCDDEDPPTELQSLLEEAAEIYLEFLENKEETGKEKTQNKKRDREQAALIRDASLNGKSYDALYDQDENSSKKSKDESSDKNSFNLNGIIDLATSQIQNTPKKQELAERRLALSEEKLKLEEKKFSIESEERKQFIEERKLQMTEEAKRNAQTLEFMKTQMEMQKEMMNMMMQFKK